MQLFIVRHAEAIVGYPDKLRNLSERGQDQIKELAHWLNNYARTSESGLRIFYSPYRRTEETATLLACRLPDSQTQCLENLLPAMPLESLIQWLSKQELKSCMLISHMPKVAELVEALCEGFGTDFVAHEFHPAQVVVLDYQADYYPLASYITTFIPMGRH